MTDKKWGPSILRPAINHWMQLKAVENSLLSKEQCQEFVRRWRQIFTESKTEMPIIPVRSEAMAKMNDETLEGILAYIKQVSPS